MQGTIGWIIGDPQKERVDAKRDITAKAWDSKIHIILRKVDTKDVDQSRICQLLNHA
jgi:hypothetical protein